MQTGDISALKFGFYGILPSQPWQIIPEDSTLVALALTENIRVLLEGRADELGLLPQVGGEESVGVGNGNKGGLEGVLEGLGAARRSRVGVGDTSQLQETLDGWGSDKSGTTGGRDELCWWLDLLLPINHGIKTYSDGDGTALSALLDGDGVRLTEVGTPVSSPDGDDGELGNDDGGADGSSDFLGGLDTETNVALGVTDDDDGLEAGTLTGTGLLLDGLDL